MILVGLFGGACGYILSTFKNPMHKNLKDQVAYWQGMYSGMTKKLKEYERIEQEDDYLGQILQKYPFLKPFRGTIEGILQNPAMLSQILGKVGLNLSDLSNSTKESTQKSITWE